MATTIASPLARLRDQANRWRVVVETTRETPTSVIAFGRRGATAVVLKLVKHESDEWYSGEIVQAFAGRGVARVYEHTAGALLLERLSPGHLLVDVGRAIGDEAATEVVASVIAAMTPDGAPTWCPTVAEWGSSFERYLATNDAWVPPALVTRAQQTFTDLCQSQRAPRLLHGDLQHSNILYDGHRGWLAVDPKGVVGELEYELGAVLRNPQEEPSLFANAATTERRVTQLSAALHVDPTRVLRWAFAQAVLSAIWVWEDGASRGPRAPVLLLADTIHAMLPVV
jgi:streptomycin 6-kinase